MEFERAGGLEDSTFNLNIIAQKPITIIQRHKKKKKNNNNNKYERRRQKAANANKEAAKQKQQQQNVSRNNNNESKVETVIVKEDNNDHNKKIIIIPTQDIDETVDHRRHSDSISSTSSSSSSSSSDEEEEEKEKVNTSTTTTEQMNNNITLKTTTIDKDNNNPIVSTTKTTTTSNNNRINENNNDGEYEKRAAYMAEFHARPYELDKRSGADKNNINIQSKESDHIFGSSTNDNTIMSWENLQLHIKLQNTLKQHFQLIKPTIIQYKTISTFLNNNANNNYIIHSETGSGKTLAYLLPIIQSLVTENNNSNKIISRIEFGTKCIILCPTRELAMQTMTIIEQLLKLTFNYIVPGCLIGGKISNKQRKSEKAKIRKGLGIIIATPGRLLDHLLRTDALILSIKNNNLKYFVLDEVDRLLDMGLGEQVQNIIQRIKGASCYSISNWQSILLSATITKQITKLAQQIIISNNNNNNNNQKISSSSSSSWITIKGEENNEEDNNKKHDDDDDDKILKQNDDADNDVINNDDLVVIQEEKQQQQQQIEEMVVNNNTTTATLPRQLIQTHISVSAKLRLTTLIALLLQRIQKYEKTIIFVSTCASVDYHYNLLNTMQCIIPNNNNNENNNNGIFGKYANILKLHGNIPHNERRNTLEQFTKLKTKNNNNNNTTTTILFTTDVASRGLNLQSDYIIQYDIPCEIVDYIHRAGRVARAGQTGQSILFLLPSERDYINILETQYNIKNMIPISLLSTLNNAANICKQITEKGIIRSGGGLGNSNKKNNNGTNNNNNNSRLGEAFSCELQNMLEECVLNNNNNEDNMKYYSSGKTNNNNNNNNKKQKQQVTINNNELLEMAQKAFLSYIRAYPTKEKLIRYIFAAKALHLGHIARSFALREPPKKLAKGAAGNNNNNKKRKINNNDDDDEEKISKKKQLMVFEFDNDNSNNNSNEKSIKKKNKKKNKKKQIYDHEERFDNTTSLNPSKARSILMANALKLQNEVV